LKPQLICFLLLVCAPGCTNHRLRASIVNQASTLTELQYQQVLGNLAMMSLDPWALPAHSTLRDGSAQIQDVGQAAIGLWLTRNHATFPAFLGSRTVVEQWTVIPVTDDIELKLMRVAYRRALGYVGEGSELDKELANDLAHELCKQISQADDIDIRSDPVINSKAIGILLDQYAAKHPLPTTPDGPPVLNSYQEKIRYMFKNFSKYRDLVALINELADALSYSRINSSDLDIISDEDLTNEDEEKGIFIRSRFLETDSVKALKDGKVPPQIVPEMATAVTREARRQVKEYYKDIREIKGGWFSVGRKKDVPRDACYVGCYRDRYVWVTPEGTRDLADFTIKILDLSTAIKDQTFLTVPGGPRFTPSTGGR
jgi:hypothetical protein